VKDFGVVGEVMLTSISVSTRVDDLNLAMKSNGGWSSKKAKELCGGVQCQQNSMKTPKKH